MVIAREYHTPDLFITFTYYPQWSVITHSILPNQQPPDRPGSEFNLSKLYHANVVLAESIIFLNMMDVGTLNLLHQHHLLLDILMDVGTLNLLHQHHLLLDILMDVGTLNLLHQHHLLLDILVSKLSIGTKMPNLHTVSLCNTDFLLKYPTNFDKMTNEN